MKLYLGEKGTKKRDFSPPFMETFQAFPVEIVLNNYRNTYQQCVDKGYYGLKFWSCILFHQWKNCKIYDYLLSMVMRDFYI